MVEYRLKYIYAGCGRSSPKPKDVDVTLISGIFTPKQLPQDVLGYLHPVFQLNINHFYHLSEEKVGDGKIWTNVANTWEQIRDSVLVAEAKKAKVLLLHVPSDLSMTTWIQINRIMHTNMVVLLHSTSDTSICELPQYIKIFPLNEASKKKQSPEPILPQVDMKPVQRESKRNSYGQLLQDMDIDEDNSETSASDNVKAAAAAAFVVPSSATSNGVGDTANVKKRPSKLLDPSNTWKTAPSDFKPDAHQASWVFGGAGTSDQLNTMRKLKKQAKGPRSLKKVAPVLLPKRNEVVFMNDNEDNLEVVDLTKDQGASASLDEKAPPKVSSSVVTNNKPKFKDTTQNTTTKAEYEIHPLRIMVFLKVAMATMMVVVLYQLDSIARTNEKILDTLVALNQSFEGLKTMMDDTSNKTSRIQEDVAELLQHLTSTTSASSSLSSLDNDLLDVDGSRYFATAPEMTATENDPKNDGSIKIDVPDEEGGDGIPISTLHLSGLVLDLLLLNLLVSTVYKYVRDDDSATTTTTTTVCNKIELQYHRICRYMESKMTMLATMMKLLLTKEPNENGDNNCATVLDETKKDISDENSSKGGTSQTDDKEESYDEDNVFGDDDEDILYDSLLLEPEMME